MGVVLPTTIVDAVHAVARLQEMTKEYGCRAVVSEVIGETAGAALSGLSHHEVHVHGREAP